MKKSIGFITYPKLGHPSAYSAPMALTSRQIPKRYKLLGLERTENAAGETISNIMANPDKSVPGPKQKFTSLVETRHRSFVPNVAHESQHSIYGKIKQQHGENFYNKL